MPGCWDVSAEAKAQDKELGFRLPASAVDCGAPPFVTGYPGRYVEPNPRATDTDECVAVAEAQGTLPVAPHQSTVPSDTATSIEEQVCDAASRGERSSSSDAPVLVYQELPLAPPDGGGLEGSRSRARPGVPEAP